MLVPSVLKYSKIVFGSTASKLMKLVRVSTVEQLLEAEDAARPPLRSPGRRGLVTSVGGDGIGMALRSQQVEMRVHCGPVVSARDHVPVSGPDVTSREACAAHESLWVHPLSHLRVVFHGVVVHEASWQPAVRPASAAGGCGL